MTIAVEPNLTRSVGRSASAGDVPAIAELIGSWAERGLTLARSAEEIAGLVDRFVVVEKQASVGGSGIAACGSLVEWPPRIAEIRSVAVADDQQGKGAGRAIVEALIAKAQDEGMDVIVLLTKTPAFFAKHGFEAVEPSDLPATYVEKALVARGRSLEGRTAMRLNLVEAVVE